MMGYRTPAIDRIAREGALFTDWHGQQSCTAGRGRDGPLNAAPCTALDRRQPRTLGGVCETIAL